MGPAPLTDAAAALGDEAGTTRWLEDNITRDMLKPPFNVRTETPGNNTRYFLTRSAGSRGHGPCRDVRSGTIISLVGRSHIN